MVASNKKINTYIISIIVALPIFLGFVDNINFTLNTIPDNRTGWAMPVSFFILLALFIKFLKYRTEFLTVIIIYLITNILWWDARQLIITTQVLYLFFCIHFFNKIIHQKLIYEKFDDFIDIFSKVCLIIVYIIFLSLLIYEQIGFFLLDNIFIYNVQQYYIVFLAQSTIILIKSKIRRIYKILYVITVSYLAWLLSSRLAIISIALSVILLLPTKIYLKYFKIGKYTILAIPILFFLLYLTYLNNFNIGEADFSRLDFINKIIDNHGSFLEILFPGLNKNLSLIYSMHNFYLELYRTFGIIFLIILVHYMCKIKIISNTYFILYILFSLSFLVIEQPLHFQAIPYIAILVAYNNYE